LGKFLLAGLAKETVGKSRSCLSTRNGKVSLDVSPCVVKTVAILMLIVAYEVAGKGTDDDIFPGFLLAWFFGAGAGIVNKVAYSSAVFCVCPLF
jgi:hypothetical protein